MSYQRIRFGDYVHETRVRSRQISYRFMSRPSQVPIDSSSPPLVVSDRLRLTSSGIYHLLAPYVGVRFWEQCRAILPLALYMILFQWLILRHPVQDSLVIGLGIFAALLGLMFFMEGLKLGLMPFGEVIGNTLPRKARLLTVLVVTFVLGVGVTFAEPAIGVLQEAGKIVVPEQAPYLSLLLTRWSLPLVLVVGAGVGIAAVIGTLRFVYEWSLKPLIYLTLIPALLLTLYVHMDPVLNSIIGLAWDCGAVTTGPVTVPLVLSLGIGVAAAVSRKNTSFSGFGIVTLASLFPILAVLILGIVASFVMTPEEIVASARIATMDAAQGSGAIFDQTPWKEIVMGVRAIVPLILFLLLVMRWILREEITNVGIIRYGVVLAVIGMILFNMGLTYGLSRLGGQSGGLVPGAFAEIDAMGDSPLFGFFTGVAIAFGFAWFLGFGATLAEPALNALGLTVETLTNGAFRKSLLMYSVSIGVAMGIGIGVLKIIFDLPLTPILLVAYTLCLVLTVLSDEKYVNVAWDSAGVTTGPVTVPLVLVMGLGFGNAVNAIDGFGILAAASFSPIISVMSFGLIVQWKMKKRICEDPDGVIGKGAVSA